MVPRGLWGPCDRVGAPGALVGVGIERLVRGGARACVMRVPAHAMSIVESGILNDRDLGYIRSGFSSDGCYPSQ